MFENLWKNSKYLPFTEAMHLYWTVDPKLQAAFNLDEKDGQNAYACWLILNAKKLRGLRIQEHANTFPRFAECMFAFANEDRPDSLPAAMYACWATRDDLRNTVDIQTIEGKLYLCGNLLITEPTVVAYARLWADFFLQIVPSLNIETLAYALWLNRKDLQLRYDLKHKQDQENLRSWLKQECSIGYLSLQHIYLEKSHLDPELVLKILCYPEVSFTQDMRKYLASEPSLQSVFNIETEDGQKAYACWLILNSENLPELEIHAHIKEFKTFGECMLAFVNEGTPHCLPAAMYACWATRNDLRYKIDIHTQEGKLFLCGNLLIYNTRIAAFSHQWSDFLLQPLPALNIRNLDYAMWLNLPELQLDFDIRTTEGQRALQNWIKASSVTEYPWLGRIYDSEHKNQRPPLRTFTDSSQKPKQPTGSRPRGVNLIGYPFSTSGIGADLRMVARALEHAKIPFVVIETNVETPAKRNELELLKFQSDHPIYDVSVICLPCGEVFKLFAHSGQTYFEDQYLIAQMPWEFSTWPQEHTPILSLLDESWALSTFIFEALKPVFSRSLYQMNRPVLLPPLAATGTKPIKSFVFLTIFDGLSTLNRKNPLAVLRSFQKAFPLERKEDVKLIIKTMNGQYDENFDKLSQEIAADPRISLINEALSREDLIQLYRDCNAYVSLHRSEGFGLTIAEAMLLEKPVVVSQFSGNMDFCNPQNCYLVSGELVSLKKGEYFNLDAFEWFNADIESAASQMRACYQNPEIAKAKAREGRLTIATNYGLENTAIKYRSRLSEIWNQATDRSHEVQ